LQGRSLSTADDLIQRAATLRDTQDMEAALAAISEAAKLSPADPQAAFGLAQISFETWRPAADLFAKVRAMAPGNADVLRNHALALAAEGQAHEAEALLEATLRDAPGWLDGHRVLAAQRITSGQTDGFDRSYANAVKADPGNGALRMMWFQQHVALKDWDKAGAILADARAALPEHKGLQLAALFYASESGAERNNAALFDAYAELGDPGLDLCRVRHHLRSGNVKRAEAIALAHSEGAAARMFWPYLSLCWRLMGDQRAQWLDGDPLYHATFDLDFSAEELAALAEVLRGLHRMKAPYPEQSVRGGTQTDRQLFFHPDPAIQSAKAKISKAVNDYIAGLPEPDNKHPLLSPQRNAPICFEGSWSVRLSGAGHHSSHTHVLGWISSAFYVALPDGEDKGHLALGTPPPELELELEPDARVEPKPGRLALFPSTMWHCTEPFVAGERLTIAFDVKLPG
jgi:tetratricopeptide (TPR) repeat protein